MVALSTPRSAFAQLGGLFGSSVEVIETEALQKQLAARKRAEEFAKGKGLKVPESDFVLVDVRSEKEIAVSIIPGAITKAQFEKNLEDYREKTVIPYCLVGGRSTAYAKKMVAKGFQVKNYKPSILGWVKAKLPLQTIDGKATNRVHTASDRYTVPDKYERVY